MCGGFGHGECESGAGLAGFGIGGPNLTFLFFIHFRSEARFVEDSGTVNPNPGPVWLDSALRAKF